MKRDLGVFGPGVYGVAFLLIVVPLTDSVLGVLPLRLGQAAWRFGSLGLLSRALMTPLLGLAVAMVMAAYLGQRRTLRSLSVFAFLAAAAALGAVILFALDALQTRATVRPDVTHTFDKASVEALLKYLLDALVAGLLGLGGWRASHAPKAAHHAEDGIVTARVVRPHTASAADRSP